MEDSYRVLRSYIPFLGHFIIEQLMFRPSHNQIERPVDGDNRYEE